MWIYWSTAVSYAGDADTESHDDKPLANFQEHVGQGDRLVVPLLLGHKAYAVSPALLPIKERGRYVTAFTVALWRRSLKPEGCEDWRVVRHMFTYARGSVGGDRLPLNALDETPDLKLGRGLELSWVAEQPLAG